MKTPRRTDTYRVSLSAVEGFVENWRITQKKRNQERALNLTSVERFVDAYARFSRAQATRLHELLKRSDAQLFPFRDPFRQSCVTNRWLKRAREESYSDWIAWTLEQLGSSTEILQCFGLAGSSFHKTIDNNAPFSIEREWPISIDEDWNGRIDILVRFSSGSLLLIEVKITTHEQAIGLSTLPRYLEWLCTEQPRPSCRRAVLLVAGTESPAPDGWQVITWNHFALELRRLARRLVRQKKQRLFAASLLNLVGAVEQNVLALGFPNGKSPAGGVARLTAYVERFLARRNGGQ